VARPPGWLEYPNDEQHWQGFVENVVMELLSSGNAFIQVTSRDSLFFPASLRVLPSIEFVVRREGGPKRLFHMPTGRYVDLFSAARPGGDFLHIAGLSDNGLYGFSPIEKAQQAIGLGLATEKFGAKFFGNGSQLAGWVEMPAGSSPNEDQLKAFAEMWRRKFQGVDKAWSVPVLANGAKYNAAQLPNDQAQFIETRKFSVSEIARLYRVPPHMIGDVERTTSWGSGIEEQGIGFVTYTLNPWIVRLERAFSQLTPRGQYLKWNVNALLRGDIQSRYSAYQTAVAGGWLNRNEVRELEDMSPVDGLDEFLIPVNQAQPQEINA
jgi:HK97 family phage portal protein